MNLSIFMYKLTWMFWVNIELTWNYKISFISRFKDVLIDRIEHEYLFYCSNLVVNGYFLITNPHKYRVGFKRDRAV